MDALSGVVAPKAAYKINVKVDWSSLHFRKISIFGSNMGFHALCLPCPQEMLNTEGDISGGYRGKLDQPIQHG